MMPIAEYVKCGRSREREIDESMNESGGKWVRNDCSDFTTRAIRDSF